MTIPACLELNDAQKRKLASWLDKQPAVEEETCAMRSPYTFEVYYGGINDVIIVRMGSAKCDLSLDDDGELL